MRYRKFFEKCMAVLLSIVTLLTCHTAFVYAESVSDNGSTGYVPSRGNHGYPLHYKSVGSTPAYCLEENQIVAIGADVYASSSLESFNSTLASGKTLSQAEKIRIAEIAYFGLGYPGREDYRYYAAAQDLIWQITDGGGAYFPDLGGARQEIEDSITNYHKAHDFHLYVNGQEVGSSGRDAKAKVLVGTIVKIVDEAGQLAVSGVHEIPSHLQLCDEKGNTIDRTQLDLSKNAFYVKVTDKNVGTIHVNKSVPQANAPKVIFTSSADQKMYVRGYIGDIDPILSQISIEGYKATIKVEKKDQADQSLKNAKLQLLNDNNQVIDEWVSDGSAHTINELTPDAKYHIHEVEAPIGYYYAKDMSLQAEDGKSYTFKDDAIKVKIWKKNELGKPVANAKLELQDSKGNVLHSWSTGKDAYDISKYLKADASYKIVEKDVDGSYYLAVHAFNVAKYSPGKEIVEEMRDEHIQHRIAKVDENGNYIPGVLLEVYDLSEDERKVLEFRTTNEPLVVNTLRRGHTYRLVEKEVPQGYYKAKDIEFTVANDTPDNVVQTIQMVDEAIKIDVVKVDIDTKEPLEGATYELKDKDGNVLDAWTQGKTAYRIDASKLQAGASYLLYETKAPKGYYQLEEPLTIEVPLEKGQDIIPVTVENKKIQIKVRKVDESGKMLEDAHITLTDKETGEIVEEWDTVLEEHDISHAVEAGKTYILKETECVKGHYLAVDQEFTVSNDATSDEIILEMVDETIHMEVRKVDESGNPLEDAKIQLIDKDTNKVIDEWTTILENHDISHVVEAGKSYILRESECVKGYYISKDVIFTVDPYGQEEEVVIQEMVDETIDLVIQKIDDSGKVLEGPKMKLIDKETNEVIDEWTSVLEPRQVGHLVEAGKTYIVEESEWVAGVHQAVNLEFTVPKHTPNEQVVVTMVDYGVDLTILKTDDTGKPIKGAKLEILDLEGNTITTLTSIDSPKGQAKDDAGVIISTLLKGGEDYILHEVEAPKGYRKAKDIQFTVIGTKENTQVIQMIDERIPEVHVPNTEDPGLLQESAIGIGALLFATFIYFKRRQYS